ARPTLFPYTTLFRSRPHPERAPFTKVLNRGASGRVYDQAACGSIDVGHPYGRRGLLRNSYGRRAPRTSAFGRSVNFCASPEKGLYSDISHMDGRSPLPACL